MGKLLTEESGKVLDIYNGIIKYNGKAFEPKNDKEVREL
jgi:hypothetical protein